MKDSGLESTALANKVTRHLDTLAIPMEARVAEGRQALAASISALRIGQRPYIRITSMRITNRPLEAGPYQHSVWKLGGRPLFDVSTMRDTAPLANGPKHSLTVRTFGYPKVQDTEWRDIATRLSLARPAIPHEPPSPPCRSPHVPWLAAEKERRSLRSRASQNAGKPLVKLSLGAMQSATRRTICHNRRQALPVIAVSSRAARPGDCSPTAPPRLSDKVTHVFQRFI